MAEYIGSRISLVSKRDIRYVGTLHEINSENSTVALEQVVSFGTEGRRPEDEIPPSDNVYEYIVFRGSDVKDLRIEKEPEKKSVQQPQIPDDPAILGNARPAGSTPSAPQVQNQDSQQAPVSLPSHQSQQAQQSPPLAQQQQRQGPPPRFPQQQPFPYYYPPPNQRFGPQGPQGFPPHGYPGHSPYGPPPGWYPPPGQEFPHPPPGQFYSTNMPPGAPGHHQNQHGQGSKPTTPADANANKDQSRAQQQPPADKPTATVKLPSSSTTPAPPAAVASGPPPPTGSKPDVVAALAPPVAAISKDTKAVPSSTKSGRIMPAVPMISPAVKPKVPINGAMHSKEGKPGAAAAAAAQATSSSAAPRPVQVPTKSFEDANRDARAAVAAAMAKLPSGPGQKKQSNGESAMDNLTNKVNEMRTNDNIRTSRHPGTGGYAAGHRGGRGAYRGGRPRTESQTKKVEVPNTDYDFATANAKFNKQDLVREAIATGSPVDGHVEGPIDTPIDSSVVATTRESENNVAISATAGYNKTSSFFDNISSESKDRDDSKKLGEREFRTEEQKKNLETFGQGSVDNSYRGGFRGRGRGRGFRGGRGGLPRGGRAAMRGGGALPTVG